MPSRNPGRVRAVLLDALGTLLELEPPAPLLRAALAERLGIEVSAAEASAAIGAEIAYYRAHLDTATDAARLAALRLRCASVLREALGPPAAGVEPAALVGPLLEALSFRPYPDAPAALRALRDAGLALVVVSNWDVSLHEVLERTGLATLVDGAVSSAEAGAPKPAGAIFARALALAGARAGEALHVGDSVDADVEGARAAGIEPVLVVRSGEPPPGLDGVAVVPDLAGVAALAAYPSGT